MCVCMGEGRGGGGEEGGWSLEELFSMIAVL